MANIEHRGFTGTKNYISCLNNYFHQVKIWYPIAENGYSTAINIRHTGLLTYWTDSNGFSNGSLMMSLYLRHFSVNMVATLCPKYRRY